jgi:hypothetical protein
MVPDTDVGDARRWPVSQGLHMRRHDPAKLPLTSPVRERDVLEQNYSCKFR